MKYEILKKLVEINTAMDKENKKIREYLKEILLSLDFTITEIGNTDKAILIAKRGNGNLAFVCHTDTVKASNNWSYNPYTLTLKNDLMFGLGVSDMKGGIAALLTALNELDKKYPCTIYFTYDEEIGFEGITTLINELSDFPKVLVFLEPTDLVPVIASKGCIEFEVVFQGKSTHSSTPNKGDNAILKANSFINDLLKYARDMEQEIDPIYEIPYATFNLGIINGGDAINKVPDKCQTSFDFRTINSKQNAKILKKVEELCQKYSADFNVINNVEAVKNNDANFAKKIEEICQKSCESINYLTEASFFEDRNILILGPGPVTAHQDDEYISKSSYLRIIEIYKELIKNINK